MVKEDSKDKEREIHFKKEITEPTKQTGDRTLTIWAAYCAEQVLSYFKSTYLTDNAQEKQ